MREAIFFQRGQMRVRCIIKWQVLRKSISLLLSRRKTTTNPKQKNSAIPALQSNRIINSKIIRNRIIRNRIIRNRIIRNKTMSMMRSL